MSKAATYAANTAGSTGKDRKPGAAEPSSAVKAADGQHSKPPRRAAADRAAAVAVAVSMGSNGGSHGREDNNSSRRPAATPKSSTAAAAAAPSRRSAWEAAAEAGKKLPPLNMSHVSKKDREAARMLLTFSTPAAQEVSKPSWANTRARRVAFLRRLLRLARSSCTCIPKSAATHFGHFL